MVKSPAPWDGGSGFDSRPRYQSISQDHRLKLLERLNDIAVKLGVAESAGEHHEENKS